MIAQLSGRIAMLDVNSVVLDVNGVGYLVQMTGRTLARLGPVGGHVTLLTEMLVREDALTLFGFAEDDERQAFKLLQTVQGVGAKASLSILTALSPAELLQAIMAADKAMVSRADGIGPKLALRIVNELASKTGAIMSLGAPASLDSGAPAADAADNQIIQDALSALVNLGYARAEVFVAVQQAVAADKTADTSAIIGAALKQLGTEQETAQIMTERLITAEQTEQTAQPDTALRPLSLAEFVGQGQGRRNLETFIHAARVREDAMDHTLLHGPPGLGKTTMAQIIASELGVGFRATSGPVIARAGDLAALLTNLAPRDVLFIDEIHRLNPAVEEVLYPAMEDGQLDLIIGEGPSARSVRIDLPRFTLVGATTRAGLLTTPLRDRFGIQMRMQFYSAEELVAILTRQAEKLSLPLSADGAAEIAKRSRGTPRVAGRLLRRVRDIALVDGVDTVTATFADGALGRLDVDKKGLEIKGPGEGRLCIAQSWPGQMRTVYGDHQRFIDTYFSQFDGKYFTGDGCRRDKDGYYWITGRVDDVIIVSGHNLGTAEIESAFVAHPKVAEAAVVGYPHDIKGNGLYCYVTLNVGEKENGALERDLKLWVRKQIGPLATPDLIHFTPGLPKTRSGKIMRRILRKIAHNEHGQLGDTTTLADPSVVDSLVNNRKNI